MSVLSGLWAGAKMVMGFGSSGGDGPNNVMTVAKGVGNFIDEQNFTEEERATFNAGLINNMADFVQGSVAENSQRSKTRREIAVLVIRWELFMLTLSAVLYRIDGDLSKYIYKICTDDPIGYLVLGIGAFFFGAHIVRQMQGAKK